ncbi:hypothetical protein PHLGIDRAFT_11814 [Phlebiopsis gigantea 11061_1 CR5-6]|uniref:Mid2 domain-containing protein n=1 Tax=Phlebiopsis gigantea (strain 11061_1 CR5-6) TaxID=745531 RepID=A0A0C3S2T3_PHLG1|nr:hypothetical protein PHLGIDRAFT_11814 [Phlebiopsis gigantea 11061_1 CR5-6]
MTFVLLALASIVLAFGPQVVLSFNSITFSAVQQCGNFSVHFSGGTLPTSLPLTLTVVPFNLTPISIDISRASWDPIKLTGVAVSFLPFPADTQFVASLDDANGASTGPVSDVIRVDPSEDASCLSANSFSLEQRYIVNSTLSQCQDFNVTYDPSVVDSPPTVRSFVPKGRPLFLNENVLASTLGRTAYSLAAREGQQVVLVFSDDTGFRQATDLLAVGGDSNSPAGCLPSNQASTATSGLTSATSTAVASSSHGGLSKGGIVAIGVVCGLSVGGIALAMAFWFCRERGRIRRRLGRGDSEIPGSGGGYIFSSNQMKMAVFLDSPKLSPGLASVVEKPLPKAPSATSGGSVLVTRNPAYTQASLDFSPAPFPRPSTSSLQLSLPDDRPRPPSIPVPVYTPKSSFSDIIGSPPRDSIVPTPRVVERGRTPSLTSDEIENILDMATLYSAPGSPAQRSRVLQVLSGDSLSSWHRSQGGSGASASPARSLSLASSPSISIRSPTTPGLLTPISASTEREPPQADLPLSPVPSPMTPGFSMPSIDEVSSQISGTGNWEIVSPRT